MGNKTRDLFYCPWKTSIVYENHLFYMKNNETYFASVPSGPYVRELVLLGLVDLSPKAKIYPCKSHGKSDFAPLKIGFFHSQYPSVSVQPLLMYANTRRLNQFRLNECHCNLDFRLDRCCL